MNSVIGSIPEDCERVADILRGIESGTVHVVTDPGRAVAVAMGWPKGDWVEICDRLPKVRYPVSGRDSKIVRAMQFWYHDNREHARRATISILNFETLEPSRMRELFGPNVPQLPPLHDFGGDAVLWKDMQSAHIQTAAAVADLYREFGGNAPDINCPTCGDR
jgi:hypothetical protein